MYLAFGGMGIYSDFTTFFTLIYIIAFASYLPITQAWPVTSETGPLPLDYSTLNKGCVAHGRNFDRLQFSEEVEKSYKHWSGDKSQIRVGN